ncbi:hypothetical protein [Kribbella sp. NPDC049227]|uniref:hypothetical protein n=1 Tax=Kribbella sp. NPDC049227 TaxID=3364113 RepID=UPI00371B6CC4
MTEAVQGGMEWVPRLGMLEVPRQRAELICGLFGLAAWVADHPELPMPWVSAVMIPCETGFQRDIRVVGDVAEALGVASAFAADGAYVAQRRFGPVQVKCIVRPVPHGAGEQESAPGAGVAR